MRLIHLLLLLATSAAPVLARDDSVLSAISLLPNCAQTCLVTAIVDSPCQLTNTTCICTDTELQGAVEKCVVSSCTVRESLTTKNVTSTICHAPVRSETTHLRVANLVMCIVTVSCAIVRLLYQTFFSVVGLGWDDYLVATTVLISIPSVVIIDLGMLGNGVGLDLWTVPFDHLEHFVQWLYTITLLYFIQSALVKITLLLFFLRIFPRRRTRQLLWGTMAFIGVWTVAFFIPASFPCLPLTDYWTAWDKAKPTKCLNIYAVIWLHAIICIVVDIWMLSIPLFEVFHLQMSLNKKLGVTLMFFVGTFVTIVSILRLKSLIDFDGTNNVTWDQTNVIVWSVYEINVGIICVCMPALRLVFVQAFPRLLSSVHASGGGSGGSGGAAQRSAASAGFRYWGSQRSSGKRGAYGTQLTGDTLASVGTAKGSVFVVGVDEEGEGGGGGGGPGIRCTKAFGIRRGAEEDEDELVPLDDFAGKMDRQRERERERESERGDSQSEASL